MSESRQPKATVYARIIEHIFFTHYEPGAEEVVFDRSEIASAARSLGVDVPKNVGDSIYSFRYRQELPAAIRNAAPPGKAWVIAPAGRSRYKFAAVQPVEIKPNPAYAETKIPDATPGIIEMYASGDEQALLAKLRYNRLLDVFTGVACYSLQSHLRTTVGGCQIETDELYVGVDRRGAHYVFPVQAKAAKERLGIVQIQQDFDMCMVRFPGLICRPIGAQFMEKDLIALFAFEQGSEGRLMVCAEKHYRLVSSENLSPEELATYRDHPFG
ncbi:MAG: endonuclease [Armatimonadetes bacterium]|nr:endonuclease [Armatimonadota bacterium]